jgi:Metallo-peptidase family M12B Reprolysin-like
MSLEQVRGLPVAQRSDIFSFGPVLYELLSERRAFKRETAAGTMAAILKEDPPDLKAGGAAISLALEPVVRRCLEKDRALRFYSAQEVSFAFLDTTCAPQVVASPPVSPVPRGQGRMSAAWLSLSLLAVFVPASLVARTPPEVPVLISRSTDPTLPSTGPDSSVLRETAIKVDFDVARGAENLLRLPLFDGTGEIELERMDRRRNREEVVLWTGRVRNEPASNVLFSARPGVLIANISTQPTRTRNARHFEIRPIAEGRHVLREFDPSKMAAELDPDAPEPLEAAPVQTCTTDPASPIDVLVLFTPKAAGALTGATSMRDQSEVYVDQANLSYADSGIEQRLRLVRAEEIEYRESGDLDTDLQTLRKPGGAMPGAHERRDAVGADLVVLIVEYPKRKTDEIGCGKASIMETVSNAFEKLAFAVVPRVCADRDISFAHELGHLMGARHDWADDRTQASSPNKPFPFSHGFVHIPTSRATRPAFRTIMAKDTLCQMEEPPVRCDRMLFWSNPDKTLPSSGVSMGVSGDEEPADNARTLNSTAKTVANFRCRKD